MISLYSDSKPDKLDKEKSGGGSKRYNAKQEVEALKEIIANLTSKIEILQTPPAPTQAVVVNPALVWAKIRSRNGQLRNYFLRGKKVTAGCQRGAALDQLTQIISEIILEVLH